MNPIGKYKAKEKRNYEKFVKAYLLVLKFQYGKLNKLATREDAALDLYNDYIDKIDNKYGKALTDAEREYANSLRLQAIE